MKPDTAEQDGCDGSRSEAGPGVVAQGSAAAGAATSKVLLGGEGRGGPSSRRDAGGYASFAQLAVVAEQSKLTGAVMHHVRSTQRRAAVCLRPGCLLAMAVCNWANAQTSPATATLKVETGVHVGQIERAVFSVDGRTLVTQSPDKTARIWDTQSGKLLGVLRTPINRGGDGRPLDLAVDATGQFIAVAVDASPAVHVFSRDQRLVRSFNVPGNRVRSMRFREDGVLVIADRDRLAAFDVTNGQRQDLASIEAKQFELAGGRIAAVIGDSDKAQEIKLCEGGGTGACRTIYSALVGHTVHRLALSPDGSRVWIGTRHFLSKVPTVKDYQTVVVDARNTSQVLISDRAPGRWVWSTSGRGIEVFDNDEVREMGEDLRPGPAWPGVMGTEGPNYYVAQTSARNSMAYANGALLYLGNRKGDSATAVFRTQDRSLGVAHEFRVTRPALFASVVLEGRFATPATETLAFRPLPGGSSCMFSGMKHGPKTAEQISKVDDKCPNLRRLPDGGALLIGDSKATRFAPDGAVMWSSGTSTASPFVRILFTMDSRFFALPGDDGILRFHSLASGRELLSVYRDGDRWVEVTESGFYRASVGAEQILGWHVNGVGQDGPDFFPLAQFRSRFHRPDVLERVMDTLDEGEALKQADSAANRRQVAPLGIAQVLPPVVELVSGSELRNSAPQVTVRVRGRTAADAPVIGWRVRVNGQLVSDARGLSRQESVPAAGERDFTVPVPPQDSEIQVFAENRHGPSAAATVRVKWAGAAPGSATAANSGTAPPQRAPKLYVLAVGVGNYQHPQIGQLNFPAKDARDFVQALQGQQGKLYQQVEVRLLTDEKATRDEVVDGLEWLQKEVTQHDVAMLFVAGHALNDPAQGYTFLPANADPDKLKRTGVTMADVRASLASLAGKALFFFDTCHAGNVLGAGRRNVPYDVSGVINELASAENGVVVFSSSTGRQFSYEDPAWGNGAFTKALVEGLGGAAAQAGNPRITHKMLDYFISERVKKLTGGKQTPVTQAPGGVPDFPVALAR